MNGVLFCRKLPDPVDAGYKFPADMKAIFRGLGKEVIHFGHRPDDSALQWIYDTSKLILEGIVKIKKNSFAYVQFPIGRRSIRFIRRRCLKMHSKMIGILIDINSLRDETVDKEEEKEFLLMFDGLIVQNERQRDYVQSLGFQGMISVMDILDFLGPCCAKEKILSDKTICYGGSLRTEQSGFLRELSESNLIKSWHINVYGAHREFPIEGANFSYLGEYTADQVVDQICGSFGLVWNGESMYTLDGAKGGYYIYATPHKMSMYLMAGMPVIIHRDSAMTEFVVKHNIGIVIATLADLEGEVEQITEEQYDEMKKNVAHIRRNIEKGYYLTRCIEEIEN